MHISKPTNRGTWWIWRQDDWTLTHTSQKQDTNGGIVTCVGVFLPTNRNTCMLEAGYVVCLEFQVFPCV